MGILRPYSQQERNYCQRPEEHQRKPVSQVHLEIIEGVNFATKSPSLHRGVYFAAKL